MIARETLETLRANLEEEKRRLEEELMRFATRDPNVPGDWDTRFPQFEDRPAEIEENAQEIEQYEKLLDVEHTLELRLKEVTDALERIQKGTYGTCAECGKEIPLARLMANPTAATCLDHRPAQR
jgi:DnaK suppressor protein